jgi:hypothetical protein
VQQVGGGRRVEFLGDIVADDLLLDRKALLGAVLGRGRGLTRQGSLTPRSVSTSLVAWMKSKTSAMPT